MKFVAILLIKLFFLSALLIISNGNLHLNDSHERQIFLDTYKTWIKEISTQSIEITGYVLSSQWLPDKDVEIAQPLKSK